MENANPENGIQPKDDLEYCTIKESVTLKDFVEFMKHRDLNGIRLPLNNPDALRYLKWVNEHFMTDCNHLNFLINIWDGKFDAKHVRPPTQREAALASARRMVRLSDDKKMDESERNMYLDFEAGNVHDAYHMWSYPDWICSGLAGCIVKWGTFEDNERPGDVHMTYEEYKA